VDADPVSALRAISLFADLDDDALTDLAAWTTRVEAPAGTVLVEVGQPGAGLFVIEDGEVMVELAGRTVRRGPGDVVGEIALLTDRPRTRARARADRRAVLGAREERFRAAAGGSPEDRRPDAAGARRQAGRGSLTRGQRSVVKCLCRPGSRSTRFGVKRFTTPTADGVVNMLTKT